MSVNLDPAAGCATRLVQPQGGSPAGIGIAANVIDMSATETDPLPVRFGHLLARLAAADMAAETKPDAPGNAAPDDGATNDPAMDKLAALLPFIEVSGLAAPTSVLALPHSAISPAAPAVAAALQPSFAAASPSSRLLSMPAAEPAITAAKAAEGAAATATPRPGMAELALGHPQIGDDALTANPAGVPTAPPAALPTGLLAVPASTERFVGFGVTIEAAESAPVHLAAAAQPPIASSIAAHPAVAQADSILVQPVGSPAWGEELGNRITWLAGSAQSRAELVLTPPDMGRIEVSLSLKGDQASISFTSTNPPVREALEAALPRLREVLADAGIQLGQAQVGADNAQAWLQQEKHGENFASDPGRAIFPVGATSPSDNGRPSTSAVLKAGRGIVDVFA